MISKRAAGVARGITETESSDHHCCQTALCLVLSRTASCKGQTSEHGTGYHIHRGRLGGSCALPATIGARQGWGLGPSTGVGQMILRSPKALALRTQQCSSCICCNISHFTRLFNPQTPASRSPRGRTLCAFSHQPVPTARNATCPLRGSTATNNTEQRAHLRLDSDSQAHLQALPASQVGPQREQRTQE